MGVVACPVEMARPQRFERLSLIRVISDYGDSALDVQGAVQSAHY